MAEWQGTREKMQEEDTMISLPKRERHPKNIMKCRYRNLNIRNCKYTMKVYPVDTSVDSRDWGSEGNIKPMTIKTVFIIIFKKLYLFKSQKTLLKSYSKIV